MGRHSGCNTYPTVVRYRVINFNSGAPLTIAAKRSSLLTSMRTSIERNAVNQANMTALTAVNASTLSGNAVTIAGTRSKSELNFSMEAR